MEKIVLEIEVEDLIEDQHYKKMLSGGKDGIFHSFEKYLEEAKERIKKTGLSVKTIKLIK